MKNKNDCKHNEYIFSLKYKKEEDSGCDTCGIEGSEFYIYRYCKDCKEQMGYVDKYDVDSNQLDNLEFSSNELTQWFEEIKCKK